MVDRGVPVQRQAGPEGSGGDGAALPTGMAATPRSPTGLPQGLKSSMERLSGYSLDDVRVHYDSPKPAQLRSLAYTQGTQIHVGPGQAEHLAHEAWHVVQQKQGRVRPTVRASDSVSINDDVHLEREADVMGHRALRQQGPPSSSAFAPSSLGHVSSDAPIQRKVGFELQTNIGVGIADKGQRIFQATNWKIEGDQGELEFITEPFEEQGDQHELEEMQTAITEITHVVKDMEYVGKRKGYGKKGAIPLSDYSRYGTPIPYHGKEVVLDIGAWVMVGAAAQPQVTGGVSLGNIGSLMDEVLTTDLPINQTITDGVPDESYPRGMGMSTVAGANVRKYQRLFPLAKRLAKQEAKVAFTDIELVKKETGLTGDPYLAISEEDIARVEGFLTYVFLYLLLGAEQTKPLTQVKYLFPLMSRTAFTAMYRALPQEYQYLEYLADDILERSRLGDGPLFAKGLKVRKRVDPGPSRSEWLQSIEDGEDLLSSALSDNAMVRDEGYGSPALGAKPTLEQDVTDGVLIEIRSLPEEVYPDYWLPMATTLFNLFRRVQGDEPVG